MTTFEFVFAFYSIIVSLAVTHMLAGYVSIRNAKSIQLYAPLIMWAAIAFIIPIVNWASLWELRLMTDWPNWTFLLLITSGLCQYLFCACLTPDVYPNQDVDFAAYFKKNRFIFLTVFTASTLVATTANFAFGATDHFDIWFRNQAVNVPVYLGGLIAFLANADWIRNIVSLIVLIIMLYFLILATSLQM